MKQTILTAMTVLMATAAQAGGIVGDHAKYTQVTCTGSQVAILNNFVQGSESLNADDVIQGQQTTIRVFDDGLILELQYHGLIRNIFWDKTNWYKGFGIDIKDVGDFLTLNKSEGEFHNIGGGVNEYKSALVLANGPIDKLPKTLEGQPRQEMLKINVRPNGGGMFTVDFNHVTSAVQKCTKTQLVPNIWAPFSPELPEMVEQCIEYAHVADAIVANMTSRTFSVNKCAVGSLPNKM